MDIIKQWESIKKKSKSSFLPGSVENIFLYNEKSSKNEDGIIPVIIKPEPEEIKKKKSLNLNYFFIFLFFYFFIFLYIICGKIYLL